jgi:excisionase family DNA binding protein
MARLITTADVAHTYGVSLTTVHRWVKRGHITAYRVGPRFLRIDADELEQQLITRVGGDAI